jgi:hypothetical protein
MRTLASEVTRMRRNRSATGGILWSLLALAPAACSSEKAAPPKACCDQPPIPPGVTPFKVVGDDVSGASDGQKVQLKIALTAPIKRDAVYPVLHALYRYAMKRNAFEPVQITADVYPSEAAASAGGDAKLIARISREQTQLAPHCDNRVAYDFPEQVERAFGASLGSAQEENLDDTCRLNPPKKTARFDEAFTHKPGYKLDVGRKAVEVAFPFLEMGKDEYVKELKLSSAYGYWIEFVTSLFRRVPDLAEVAFVGVYKDAPALQISLTRAQFDATFSRLQETIAAHAAITFQSLGMHRVSDKGAEKEQDTFKNKTYKDALAALPKSQVTISQKLK